MTDGSRVRSYHSPLRAQQASDTRKRILQAAAELIADDGPADFAMREVAARAGVSERTVYYHFPNRQALLDGLTAWVTEQLHERRLASDPREIDDMPGRSRELFAAFEEIGAPARAMARLSSAQGLRSREHEQRTAQFRERFADLLEPLPPAEADRCFAVLRYLLSASTWAGLRDEFDLSGQDAAEAIAWALQTLLDDLGRRAG